MSSYKIKTVWVNVKYPQNLLVFEFEFDSEVLATFQFLELTRRLVLGKVLLFTSFCFFWIVAAMRDSTCPWITLILVYVQLTDPRHYPHLNGSPLIFPTSRNCSLNPNIPNHNYPLIHFLNLSSMCDDLIHESFFCFFSFFLFPFLLFLVNHNRVLAGMENMVGSINRCIAFCDVYLFAGRWDWTHLNWYLVCMCQGRRIWGCPWFSLLNNSIWGFLFWLT